MSFVVRGTNDSSSSGGGAADVGSSGRATIVRTHDRSVLFVRYVAVWQMVFSLAYDNCLRVYECSSGPGGAFVLKHCWENENRCHFTSLEVDLEFHEVR